MSDLSWSATKKLVYECAKGCCEYCQTCEVNIGQSMHVEQIHPSGGDDLSNLCLSCANCNLSKATATQAIDPLSEQESKLFNPRTDLWVKHFQWDETNIFLRALTPIGRATIARLKKTKSAYLLQEDDG